MKLLVISGLFAAAVAVPVLADDFTALPAGDGRDTTVKICSQCHSPELAASQRLDLQGWKDLVNQMANNGAQGTDADFNTISQYLATAFPATPAAGAAPAAAGAAPAAPGAAPAAPAADAAPATPGAAPAGDAAPAAPGAAPATPPAAPATPPPAQ